MLRLFLFVTLAVATMAEEVDDGQLLTTATNQFTAKMFSEVVENNPDKSVVLSAFSVMTPLAQLAFGSVGESHDELLKSIGMPNDNSTKAVFSQLNNRLKSSKDITLQMASKIYVAKSYNLHKEFSALSRDVFRSDVQNIDFVKNVESAAEMNAWVEDQTNHRIKDLVESSKLDGDTRAVLLNAIYFKGSWKYPFIKDLTEDKDFHVSKDKVIKVPTMYAKNDYKYAFSKELDAQIIELPYSDEDASMIIVLPKEVDGITELVKKLKDPTILDQETKKMFETEVEVHLPKFKIETTTDLKEVLTKINVQRVFNPQQARLDKIVQGQELYVSDARQKACIEVNEEGAEAAAANEFGIQLHSGIEFYSVPTFDADRPFYYVVNTNSMALFCGVARLE